MKNTMMTMTHYNIIKVTVHYRQHNYEPDFSSINSRIIIVLEKKTI